MPRLVFAPDHFRWSYRALGLKAMADRASDFVPDVAPTKTDPSS